MRAAWRLRGGERRCQGQEHGEGAGEQSSAHEHAKHTTKLHERHSHGNPPWPLEWGGECAGAIRATLDERQGTRPRRCVHGLIVKEYTDRDSISPVCDCVNGFDKQMALDSPLEIWYSHAIIERAKDCEQD
jgi:hypothetical protein